MAREDIEFTAQGATLRGWFYPPEDGSGPAPSVVLQHGFSGVKEMSLDSFAELFQAAGLSCLVYDHPGFGASEPLPGTPRLEIDPWQQVRCIQHAISYAQSRPEVDADRIGLWGSSYGGGHALVVAATDRRVKAVVSQVPFISGSQTFKELIRIDNWAALDAAFAGERQARFAGAEPTMLPVVDPDPTVGSALPTHGAYEWFMTTAEKNAPAWRNEVTFLTLEFLRAYEPASCIHLIAPTPLLMVVAPLDRLADGQLATAAFDNALHPKKLVLIPGGHFDPYWGITFGPSSVAARDWFVDHLITKT